MTTDDLLAAHLIRVTDRHGQLAHWAWRGTRGHCLCGAHWNVIQLNPQVPMCPVCTALGPEEANHAEP